MAIKIESIKTLSIRLESLEGNGRQSAPINTVVYDGETWIKTDNSPPVLITNGIEMETWHPVEIVLPSEPRYCMVCISRANSRPSILLKENNPPKDLESRWFLQFKSEWIDAGYTIPFDWYEKVRRGQNFADFVANRTLLELCDIYACKVLKVLPSHPFYNDERFEFKSLESWVQWGATLKVPKMDDYEVIVLNGDYDAEGASETGETASFVYISDPFLGE